MTWVGIDDTDSPKGGCTTFALTEVIRTARRLGFDLIGDPRLVRLNPNIPFKTRGNAALAARFGHGWGAARRIGMLPEGPVRAYARGRPLDGAERETLLAAAWESVLAASDRGAAGTDPALVVAPRALPSVHYWNAVRSVVDPSTVPAVLERHGARWRTEGSGRGLVGAAAALAWPGRRATWEMLAYRSRDRVGTPREVDGASVRAAASRHGSLFLCYDRRTRRLLVTPHTDCPILFGIRSTSPDPLYGLVGEIRSEPVDRWLVFRTNQATGDHLVSRRGEELAPHLPAIVEGTLVGAPNVGPGGHVTFALRTDDGVDVPCVVFEPTKTLPRVARSLAIGDRLRLSGGCGADSSLRVERIELLWLEPRWGAARPPRCPSCERRMGSSGAGRGYRCRRCRRRAPPEAAERSPRTAALSVGCYDPTPSARRHLHPRSPE